MGSSLGRCRHSGEAKVWTRERNGAWPLDLKDKPSLRTPHSFAPRPLWVAVPALAAGSFCRTRAVSQALSSLANSHLSQEEEEGEEQAVKVALILHLDLQNLGRGPPEGESVQAPPVEFRGVGVGSRSPMCVHCCLLGTETLF